MHIDVVLALAIVIFEDINLISTADLMVASPGFCHFMYQNCYHIINAYKIKAF